MSVPPRQIPGSAYDVCPKNSSFLRRIMSIVVSVLSNLCLMASFDVFFLPTYP